MLYAFFLNNKIMTAREWLKGLNEHDPVREQADEYEYTEDQLINFAERYADKKLKYAKFGVVNSGIFDKNNKEIKVGDTLQFPYVTPNGQITNDVDFEKEVVFEFGCYGYWAETTFTPLMEWMETKRGEYISNAGNKKIYTKNYYFWVKS